MADVRLGLHGQAADVDAGLARLERDEVADLAVAVSYRRRVTR